MSQPTLFYSNRCAYCRQVLQTMDTMQKSSLVNAVCIDGMQRHQLPAFLKKVPTLQVPDTKDVQDGQQIMAWIAKPVTRREVPSTQTVAGGVSRGGAPPSAQTPANGESLEFWGGGAPNAFTESYSLWDTPNQFADRSQSRQTQLDGGNLAGPPDMSPQNLQQKDDGGGSSDIQKRLQALQQQRDKEFTAISRQ